MIFYDTTVKIKRLKGAGNVKSFVATATGEASIQPLTNEPGQLADGRFGVLYIAYVEVDLPAQAGDKLTDPDGTVYVIKEVVKRDTVPFPHQALTLTKQT